jgi:hypothetical protein
MREDTGRRPHQLIMKFIREVTQRQRRRLWKLAIEKRLVPPLIFEDIDADGERFLNQLWDVDENRVLYLVEDNLPDDPSKVIGWPTVMKLTDSNGTSVQLCVDDVCSTDDTGLHIVFPDKRPFNAIKAIALQVFGENVASSLQPNQLFDFSDFLKPNTRTYEIALEGCLESNLEKIDEFFEGRAFLIFHQHWNGLTGPKSDVYLS